MNSGFLYLSLTVTTENETLVVPGLLVIRTFCGKKNREVIREEKMEKTKGRKEVNAELFIVEYEE